MSTLSKLIKISITRPILAKLHLPQLLLHLLLLLPQLPLLPVQLPQLFLNHIRLMFQFFL